MLAVADVSEALTADRPFRHGMPIDQSLESMRRDAGTALCAETVAALERGLAPQLPRAA